MLTSTLQTAAKPAVPQASRWVRSVAGPDQVRPEGAECHGQTEQADQDGQAEHLERRARGRLTSQEAHAQSEGAPTTATGTAGVRSTSTRTVTATTVARPTPTTGGVAGSWIRVVRRKAWRWKSPTIVAVTRAAAEAGQRHVVEKARPERCRCPSTITLVRLEPGKSREPALARRMEA